MVRILAPLSKTPNAKDQHRQTAISRAAKLGNLEIIEILAPLVYDPNDADDSRQTPIYHAAKFGHTEIVKFLAPLTKNPNAIEGCICCNLGTFTPSGVAQMYGHDEIAGILQSYMQ